MYVTSDLRNVQQIFPHAVPVLEHTLHDYIFTLYDVPQHAE